MKHSSPRPLSSFQSGNVLFLILIAVALFAALSFVVSKSSRGTADSGANEKASLGAGRIMNFGSNVQAAISRYMVTNGKDITDLKFNNDIYKYMDGSLVFTSMGTPADPKPYIFHPQGGAIIPLLFENLAGLCTSGCTASTTTKGGHFGIRWTNIPNIGTNVADPAIFVMGINDAVCTAINAKLGITGIPSVTLPLDDFVGTTSPPATTQASGTNIATVTGKTEFCYRAASGPIQNNYLRVVAQR